MSEQVETILADTGSEADPPPPGPDWRSHPAQGYFSPRVLLADLAAGTIAGALSVVMAVSFASLIFSGSLAIHAATGIGLALYSAVVAGLVTSFGSSFPSMVGMPQGIPALIMGIIAAAIVDSFPAGAAESEVVTTVVIAMAATTILTGAFAWLLGHRGMSRLIRFIPYPVVGGFLAGTGWLLCRGGIGVMVGAAPVLDTVPDLLEPPVLWLWAPGVGFALVMLVCNRLSRSLLVLPGLLAAGFGLFFVGLHLSGISLDQARASGWLLDYFDRAHLWRPLPLSALTEANWALILEQSGSVIVILITSVTALLLNATGLELAAKRDIDFDQELKCAGVANVISGLGGGMVCFQGISLSLLMHKLEANRLAGIVVAAVCGLTLYYGPSLLSFVPKWVLGGVLVYLGLSLLLQWLVDARHTLSRIDYVLVVLILSVIGTVGFLEGVAVGMTLAVMLFAFNLSRTSIIKHTLTGSDQKSSVQRSEQESHLMERLGRRIWVLELQGYMFFGTANSLLEKTRQRLVELESEPLRYLILDFRQVIGLDSSAAFSLRRLGQISTSHGVELVFSHLSKALSEQLASSGVAAGGEHGTRTFHDLDQALEWCENELLAGTGRADRADDKPLQQHLESVLGSQRAVTELLGYMERFEVPTGATLIREGDPPEYMYLLESGRVSVRLQSRDRRTMRLRTMNAGTTVGEIGLYLNSRRSATVIAEQPTTVYRLSRDSLLEMERQHPEVAYAFHKLMVHVEAERLVSLNQLLLALRR